MGNDYRAVAFFETKVTFNIKLVEGNDEPKEGTRTAPTFEEEMGLKILALCLRMAKSTWISGRGFLDSRFGHVANIGELRKKGTCSTTVIRKKRFFQNVKRLKRL